MPFKKRPLSGSHKPQAGRVDLYQHVTDKIVAAIESGSAGKWVMPWHRQPVANSRGFAMMPESVSGRPYRGINVWLLMAEKLAAGYTSDVWGTYKAWAATGAHVRAGQKATLIIFWKKLVIKERDETGEEKPKSILMARGYNVFNADQVEGWQPKAKPTLPAATRIEAAEAFFAGIPADVRHGGNRAYYTAGGDFIGLPEFAQFHNAEAYYATRGHETVHWTGHKSRCNREFGARFGDKAYAFEELVAELGAAYLAGHLAIANDPRPDHAAYLANWLEVLKGDKRAIFTAASRAQAAVDFIIGEAADAEEDDASEEMGLAA